MGFRLCLVAVKRFPENTYFPEMLISGKGKCFHVFGCILKKFPENIFWCLVFGKEEGKHKSENPSHNPEKKNHQRRPRHDRDPTSRSRLLREIAPRTGARARTGARTGARDLGLELELVTWTGSSPLARARALSLSHSFSGNALKGK